MENILEKIKKHIDKLEKRNNQSVKFTFNNDGSGNFEDFWNDTGIISFDNEEELIEILKD